MVTESLAYLAEGKRVAIESVYGTAYGAWRMWEDPACRFFRLPPPLPLPGPWTSIVSRWVPTCTKANYTHWLLDALPRLALLDELPPDTRIIVPQLLGDWQKESLQLLGLWDRCRPTAERHLQIESYYFSSPTTMLDCYNPYGVQFLRRALLPKRDPSYHGPRRFVLRRSGKWREPINAEEMYASFEKAGWSVVDTEKMTFAQELALFSEADAVAGMLGSGLTNAVFCKPGCAVIHIAPDFVLDGWLDWIVQVVGCHYEFLVCPTDYQQCVHVDIEALKRAIGRMELLKVGSVGSALTEAHSSLPKDTKPETAVFITEERSKW